MRPKLILKKALMIQAKQNRRVEELRAKQNKFDKALEEYHKEMAGNIITALLVL